MYVILYKQGFMKAITVSNFRSNMKNHLDEVSENSEIIIIPRNNNEDDAIVVMSIKEYNSIKENEYLLGNESNRQRLQKSLKQVKSGKTVKFELDEFSI